MKIQSITLDNFRSFYSRTKIDNLKQVNIFVGPNNVGKSNIVRALHLINDLVENNVPNRSYVHMAWDKDEPLSIEIEVELSLFERRQIIDYNLNQSKPLFENIDLAKNDIFKRMKYILTINIDTGISQDIVQLWNSDQKYFSIIENRYKSNEGWLRNSVDLDTHLYNLGKIDFSNLKLQNTGRGGSPPNQILVSSQDNSTSRIAEYLADFFKQIKIYSAYRIPVSQLKAGEARQLDPNSSNLVKVANTMQAEPEIYKRFSDNFSKIIDDTTITAPLVGENATIRMRERSIEDPIDIENVSTGIQQSLSLLFAIEGKKQHVICIEEPEVHLHPTAQRKIFEAILEKAKTIQFFITTHSSIFTDLSDITTTYLITKDTDASEVTEITDENNFKIVKQQLGIRNSDFYGKDYVLFIEGESEEVAIPIIAKVLGYELGNKIKIFNLHGNGNITNLRHILYFLRDSGTEPFLIADGAKGIYAELGDLQYSGLSESNVVVWEKEFEDNFSDEIIIQAVRKIMPPTMKLELTSEELTELRKTRKVDKILSDYLYNKHSILLKKPDLARNLALILCEEIQQNTDRKKTYLEEKIEQIMNKMAN